MSGQSPPDDSRTEDHLAIAANRIFDVTTLVVGVIGLLIGLGNALNPEIDRGLLAIGFCTAGICAAGRTLRRASGRYQTYFLAAFGLALLALLAGLALEVQLLLSTPSLILLVLVMATTLVGGFWPGLVATLTALGAFCGNFALHHSDAPIAYFAQGQFIDWRIALVSLCGIAVILFLAAALFRSQMVIASQRLDKARRDAVASDVAKSAFLANMSHEIRTPMNGVLGMLDLVLASNLPPAQEKDLQVARRAAGTLLSLLDDVLDVSKLEAGAIAPAPEPCATLPLFESAAALFRPAAEGKGVALLLEFGPGLPEALMVDPLRITQVVSNLLSNAVKFTDSGTIVLRVGHVGGRLTVEVIDNGIGIDEAVLPSLFERFRQAEAGTVRRYGGTGLGLAICKELTELMGGEIDARSVKGEGSRFRFTLPAPETALPAAPASHDAEAARPLDILVAEDNQVNRMVVGAFLDRLGHRHTMAADGGEAFEAAKLGGYDLVLMDVSMPVMDGFTAARAIGSLPEPPPILALTAHVTPDIEARCRDAGMVAVLHKPLTLPVLRAALAQHGGPALGSEIGAA